MMRFEEVETKQLNSDGTDFWVGVGVGTGFTATAAGVAGLILT